MTTGSASASSTAGVIAGAAVGADAREAAAAVGAGFASGFSSACGVGVAVGVAVGVGVGVAVGVAVAVGVGVGVGVLAGFPEVQVTELPSALRTQVMPEFVAGAGDGEVLGVGCGVGVLVPVVPDGVDSRGGAICTGVGDPVDAVSAAVVAFFVVASFPAAPAAPVSGEEVCPVAFANARRAESSACWACRTARLSAGSATGWTTGVIPPGAEDVATGTTAATAPTGPCASTIAVVATIADSRIRLRSSDFRRRSRAPATWYLPAPEECPSSTVLSIRLGATKSVLHVMPVAAADDITCSDDCSRPAGSSRPAPVVACAGRSVRSERYASGIVRRASFGWHFAAVTAAAALAR